MERLNIYEEIAKRSGGDIYVGVVGPVRTGKSMFITKFMENLVIPNMVNKFSKERTIDELTQSGEGKTIMTTQPKFVPNEAVKINLDNVEMKVRLIDCVGYMINGALGHEENDKPRLVKTPWNTKEIPFEDAAEIGTKKVIEEHSTIGILLTTDGSISDIPRSSYLQAEERVAAELTNHGKPFVTVINSLNPNSPDVANLANSLSQKYNCATIALNVKEMTTADIENIFAKVLLEFPIRSIKAKMPDWLQALPFDNEIIKNIIEEVKRFGKDVTKIGHVDRTAVAFADDNNFEPISLDTIKMGEGTVYFNVRPKQDLFYRVLSSECGCSINNDYELVTYLRDLVYAKKEYDKIANALEQVKETGYGIVEPRFDEIELDEPQIVKQGSRFGVKLKANAPSLHIMSVNVETEVSPLVGTQAQSEELVTYLSEQCEKDPTSIWQTNMFGKSLKSMVCDGIRSKVYQMPTEAQRKMRKTLGRIVNEGKGGIICILL